MGLMLSLIIAYAGVNDGIATLQHIISGILPDTDPDFRDYVEYYSRMLQKSANPANPSDWTTEYGQGYLCLNEDDEGNLKSAAVKYYGSDSTAILFSTKISSFGQDSVDAHANGDYRTDRYTPTRTKTIITNTSDSFSVGNRNRSPTPSGISDPPPFSESSFENSHDDEKSDASEKLTWHYRPKSPIQPTLPEIQFQSYDDEKTGVQIYSDDYLRSLDGIKFRPLQRSDPSGRRRSFKKRHSSSSTSSRDSRASREEELKLFTSLEEAEFGRMNSDEVAGSAPNLAARSYSRSRSRENSKERRNESWSMEASVDSAPAESSPDLRPRMSDVSKLGSFVEEKEDAKEIEVNDEEEDVEDFWGNSGE